MADDVRGIIDSMDALQHRLRGVSPASASSVNRLADAKRTLLGKQPEFVFGRPVQPLATTVKKSGDRVYLEGLVAETDRMVAMLTANN
jgi:hypothetical protein